MNENSENGMELTNAEKSNAANEKSEVKEELPVPWRERIRRLANWFTVEPFVVLYFLSLAIGAIAYQKLLLEKACRVSLNYNETDCSNVLQGINNDNRTIATRQDSITASLSIAEWQSPMQTSIPAILTPFVGAWSDRTGNRKMLMIVPLIGEIVASCGLLLASYFFLAWPLWLTGLVEVLPSALCGSITIALMGAYSHLADTTTLEARTFRVGVLAIVGSLSLPLGTSLSGILLEALGRYGVFTIQLILRCLGLSYVYFRIQNKRSDATEGTFIVKLKSFFNPFNVWDTICLVIVTPLRQRIRVILVVCAYVIFMGPNFGKSGVTYFYAKDIYLLTDVEYSIFQTYSTLIGLVGTTIAVTLFSKYLKMHDALLGVIAITSSIVSSLVYGLAPTKQWYFSAPAFDIFANTAMTALKSIGTKIVEPDQLGKLFSLFGLTDVLISFMYVPLFLNTYSATISSVPGAVYFLASVMESPALIIFIILYFLLKKQSKDVVANPAEKEKHAYDNDVTAL